MACSFAAFLQLSKSQHHFEGVSNKNSSTHFAQSSCNLDHPFHVNTSIGHKRSVNFKVKSHENISKMAEFLGSEFGQFEVGVSKFKGHELLLNEENMKRSSGGVSKAISKSSSRDCLDGRKVSLASMPSPKSTKHFRSVDDAKYEESKVEIKITDDGILVISDKETTV